MIDISRFEEILDLLAEELPAEFYEELNGGILLLPEALPSPHAKNGDLYIMGQYFSSGVYGKYIAIYYGSFAALYGHLSEEALTEKMRKTLRHEFRHHMEDRAGADDLVREDKQQIDEYKNR